MKTIEQHNKQIEDALLKQRKGLTDIECPICHKELIYANDSVYLSNPPQREVKCECGYFGYILA